MTKHESPSQPKKRKSGKQQSNEKKLYKSEQRLQESLQKAQEEHAKVQTQLERAQVRLQKRLTRVQRLEEHLGQVRQRLGIAQEPVLVPQSESSSSPSEAASASPLSASDTLDVASPVAAPLLSAQTSVCVPATEIVSFPASSDLSLADPAAPVILPTAEAEQRVWQARTVVEVAEEEARTAAERALTTSLVLDKVPQAEPVASELKEVAPDERAEPEEMLEAETITETGEDTSSSSTEKYMQAASAQEEIRRVTEIAREEEQLEEGVVRTHAEAAAIAAAEAEALAESSSARTRKARILARQADQELTLVRAAIRNGSLVGEKAEATLQAAERKSTHAHAELDDAEDAEERAISVARNAEAEAEVAEEMAFSAHDHYVDDSNGRAVQAIADQEEQRREEFEQLNEATDRSTHANTDEVTEKLPVARSQIWRE